MPTLIRIGLIAVLAVLVSSWVSPGSATPPRRAARQQTQAERTAARHDAAREQARDSADAARASTRENTQATRATFHAERQAFWSQKHQVARGRLEEWRQRRLTRLVEIRNVASQQNDAETLSRLDRLEELVDQIYQRRINTLKAIDARIHE